MKKLTFQWKTVLKGICALLSAAACLQSYAQQSAETWNNLNFQESAVAQVPIEGSQAPVRYDCEPEVPDGLFLHRLNSSPGARWGSGVLGPGSFFIDGHISQGLSYSNADSDYRSPMGTCDRDGYQMNQLYLSLGRKVEKSDRLSVGGQVDFMFGTDYYYMASAGLENTQINQPHWNAWGDDARYRAGRDEYGFAMPQIYGEVYAPIFGGVDLKIGHFNSVMGYESLESTKNFFYSHSYARIYGMPTSMTGVMGSTNINNYWEFIYGAVNEWNAFDTENDNFSGVLGLKFKSRDGFFTFGVSTMFGDQSAPSYQFETYGEPDMTFVLNTYAQFKFTPKFPYAIEFTAGYDDREYFCMETFGMNHGRAWFGLTNYVYYQLFDTLALGARVEWFCDCDNTVIDGGYGFSAIDDSANYFAVTFGANWTPLPWMTIRPEIRYDFSDFEYAGMKTYDAWTTDDQLTVGADLVIRF